MSALVGWWTVFRIWTYGSDSVWRWPPCEAVLLSRSSGSDSDSCLNRHMSSEQYLATEWLFPSSIVGLVILFHLLSFVFAICFFLYLAIFSFLSRKSSGIAARIYPPPAHSWKFGDDSRMKYLFNCLSIKIKCNCRYLKWNFFGKDADIQLFVIQMQCAQKEPN